MSRHGICRSWHFILVWTLDMDIKYIIETIHSGMPGIHIQGQDFFRIDEGINSIAMQLEFEILEWNLGYGWVDFQTKQPLDANDKISLYQNLTILSDSNPSKRLYVIKNICSTLKDDPKSVARLQQELLRIRHFFNGQSAIFFIDKSDMNLPELSDLFMTFQCPPLALEQVEALFQKDQEIKISTVVKSGLASICSGMERDTVFRLIQKLKNKYGNNFPENSLDEALILKKKSLSQSGLLELIDSPICTDQIGGMDQLKSWLRDKKCIMDDLQGAQRLGIVAPKGIMLVGMPGCGKSMSAKATSSMFKVPLLRLDIGSLMGKFVGESEANMKSALAVAEKASPCVLWIDELEKAFAGVNGSGGSTEITTRLFGYFLTWMQEKPSAVFVVATANDISSIPPELLRRGRFDEIFYIDLPNQHERRQIFEVKANALNSKLKQLDFKKLSEESDGFSGADIECVMNDALEYLFRNHQSVLTQTILLKHIQSFTPISEVLKDKISIFQKKFEEFKLKPASFSEKEIDDLSAAIGSNDVSEREEAALSACLPNEDLLQLVRDDSPRVRQAALRNPQCPVEALQYVVEHYQDFDFSQPGAWNESQIKKEDFDLALQHANMPGHLIAGVYGRKKITSEKFLSLAHKLSKGEQGIIFQRQFVKLPQKIASGQVQAIHCASGTIVKPNGVLIEIDDETGSNKFITAPPFEGLVMEVCVKVHDNIVAGEKLMRLMILKSN